MTWIWTVLAVEKIEPSEKNGLYINMGGAFYGNLVNSIKSRTCPRRIY